MKVGIQGGRSWEHEQGERMVERGPGWGLGGARGHCPHLIGGRQGCWAAQHPRQ